jgi:hypothetical protein
MMTTRRRQSGEPLTHGEAQSRCTSANSHELGVEPDNLANWNQR